ncbi:Holliday junction endonuclease RuvC [Goodfellowiella coeruleoviolacea]|uniref:Crossover junction endodeoxyribonuclease RuvC n=1 Tax=Goodfellowiella coeruleoviolacea TaxID=334858 RepID=A0AAE3KHP1_9PSEU|nr:Holliday junction endonuclease RuvC [Goodfellowiella coeruleoviolacea]
MRVLGVDPGLTRCGLGVVDGGPGRTVRCVAVDVVRTPVDADLAIRLLQVADAVEQWLDLHRPEVVAVERVFSQYNVRTAMGTAQAGGVVALSAARRGIPVVFHTPSEVKAAVTGSGRADKAQVTTMVTRLLRLAEAPRPADAADALALAICHLWRAPMRSRLADAQARAAQLARTHRARLAAGQEAAGAARTATRSAQQPAPPTRSARSARSAGAAGGAVRSAGAAGSGTAGPAGDPQSGGPVTTPAQPGTGGADR